jgi:hypothetical protein
MSLLQNINTTPTATAKPESKPTTRASAHEVCPEARQINDLKEIKK